MFILCFRARSLRTSYKNYRINSYNFASLAATMATKRKSDSSSEAIKKKIEKLEHQLQQKSKRYNRLIIYSDSEDEGSDMSSESRERNVLCSTPIANQAPVQAGPALIADGGPSTSTSVSINPSIETLDAAVPNLDKEILELLGDAPKSETKFGKPTYKDLASRWQEILEKGLVKEVKEHLIEAYLIPENCDLLVAPSLNPEVKAALADNLVKRDNTLFAKQKQLSIAIAAINQAIELIIAKEQHTKILKPISDACRLLCDSHFSDTKTRRGFVISAINPDMKETLSETKRNKLLFGDNVSEKLKSAKTIKRSGADLKQVKNYRAIFNKNNFVKTDRGNNRLNWKTIPRKITPRGDAGKPRQQQRPGPQFGSQRRETVERPAVIRGGRRR